MTQEDKELLLKDLCARLPYGVKLCYEYDTSSYYYLNEISPACKEIMIFVTIQDENRKYCAECVLIEEVKPYLRSMSLMTEEERKNFIECAGYEVEESENGRHYDYYLKDFCGTEDAPCANADAIDWLNANHFDYRGLIKKGLAIEAPKDMYK